MTATKLPTDDRPLVRDPDLAAALEKELEPYSGEPLKRAQAAIRRERLAGVQGTYDVILARYRKAIKEAASEKRERS